MRNRRWTLILAGLGFLLVCRLAWLTWSPYWLKALHAERDQAVSLLDALRLVSALEAVEGRGPKVLSIQRIDRATIAAQTTYPLPEYSARTRRLYRRTRIGEHEYALTFIDAVAAPAAAVPASGSPP